MKSYKIDYHFTDFTNGNIMYDSMVIDVPNNFPVTREYFEFVFKSSNVNHFDYKVDKFLLISNNKLEF